MCMFRDARHAGRPWMYAGRLAAVLLLACAAPRPAAAQDLAFLVPDLILLDIRTEGGNPGSPHAGHFTLGNPTSGGSQAGSRADLASIAAVEAFGERMKGQFANFPLGSSTGGFTYTYDPVTRIYSRGSGSFGPAFAERATTIGQGKLSIGANYQHTSFDTFGSKSLSDGSIVFYLPHTDCCPLAQTSPSPSTPGFEGDIVRASLTLRATSDTMAVFANYGLTNRWDVGFAIPVTRVELDANVHATLIRLSSAGAPSPVHTFEEGKDVTEKDFSRSGNASGLGDVVARTKYTLLQQGSQAIAAGVDLRLPTGDWRNLLGIGAPQAKLYLIASSARDRISPHVNFGYTISGKGSRQVDLVYQPLGINNEMNYSGGVELVPHARLTVLGDIIGRTLIDAGNLREENRTFQYRVGAGATAADPLLTSTINPLTGQPYSQLALQSGNLNLLLGSIGAKANIASSLLLSGNVLFPLNSNGLRDTLAYTIGFEYAF